MQHICHIAKLIKLNLRAELSLTIFKRTIIVDNIFGVGGGGLYPPNLNILEVN